MPTAISNPATSADRNDLHASTAHASSPLANPPPSVIEGLLNRKQLAADLDRTERTVIRYERAGMPFIRLGMMRLYEPDKVRSWLLSHEQCPKPVTRGRPANKRAA